MPIKDGFQTTAELR